MCGDYIRVVPWTQWTFSAAESVVPFVKQNRRRPLRRRRAVCRVRVPIGKARSKRASGTRRTRRSAASASRRSMRRRHTSIAGRRAGPIRGSTARRPIVPKPSTSVAGRNGTRPTEAPRILRVAGLGRSRQSRRKAVFDSAVEGFLPEPQRFLRQLRGSETDTARPHGTRGVPDILVRLTRAPVVSIALIRGRATGNGSEIALACDMTFVYGTC
jgi:hypothetical protein